MLSVFREKVFEKRSRKSVNISAVQMNTFHLQNILKLTSTLDFLLTISKSDYNLFFFVSNIE